MNHEERQALPERGIKQMRTVSMKHIAALLVKHRLIDGQALEDPEGFDNYRTWDAANAFILELFTELFPQKP